MLTTEQIHTLEAGMGLHFGRGWQSRYELPSKSG